MEKIILVGGGGHCKVIIDALKAMKKFKCAGIVDPALKVGSKVSGVAVIGSDKDLAGFFKKGIKNCFISVGSVDSCAVRLKIFRAVSEIGFNFPNIIHPKSVISSSVVIGTGNYIAPGAIINAGAKVGNQCIINTGAVVEHDCVIGDFAHIGPGANLSGGVLIGECSHIGNGASVKHLVKIGSDCVIGTGSAVVGDIPDRQVAFGNPCREQPRNT